jgi:hypothetical protein
MKRTRSNAKKGKPHPVRFDRDGQEFLDEMANLTGLSKAELIRRAGRFAFSKFLSGEINLLDITPNFYVKTIGSRRIGCLRASKRDGKVIPFPV